ncbi:MAG: AraC family transcriptional regulator [Betaproteobacteria bacterium]|nr:AraC family transcriptional regulator [Betaproteobacteria bacterium]
MNRSHSWTDYQERLSRVIAYVHDHLAEELSLEQLAEVAHLSPFHWHRTYHALHGETMAATIRRLRLHRASGYLANTQQPVARIATLCGYPNAQSFTRAFRTLYGMAPMEYRAKGSHVLFRQGQAHVQAAGYAVDIRYVPAVQLAGLPHRGSYMRIGKAFENGFARMGAQGLLRQDTRWLALYHDDPAVVPEKQLRAWAGLSLPTESSAMPPLEPRTLGGCVCAVLRHRGPYSTMGAAYQWLYGSWLLQSGREALDQPVFEEYLNNPRDTAPPDLLTEICLPLRE